MPPKPAPSPKHPTGKAAPRLHFPTRAALRRWLKANHASHGPIWLIYNKLDKASPKPRELTYDDIVEEALCFGWIDSVVRAHTATQAMLYFSPRKPKSVWSAVNKRRIESLRKRGLMTPAGEALITAAKAHGTWSVLDAAESLTVPPDFAAALKKVKGAKANFDAFPPGARKVILTWITIAKKPETRAARVAESARLAGLNIRANTPQARGK
jgi:uncharacterized protein YdeI (YjbR/CyaY-like superfamily)